MIKDLVVNLPVRGGDVVTPFAASMAGYFNAHLTGIAFVYDPVTLGAVGDTVPAVCIDELIASAKKHAQEAVDRFKSEVKAEQISSAVLQIESSAENAPTKFGKMAHAFDFAVVGQPNPDQRSAVDDLIVEATLFGSGRPTMVVPYIHDKQFRSDRITVCWDGSRAATRAIADSLPLLSRALSVDLMSVYGENSDRTEFASDRMAGHLSRHGIKVKTSSYPIAKDVASTILNFVADNGTDLLVMGGYGHSRLREFFLGGTTRSILQSMTVPTLMSH